MEKTVYIAVAAVSLDGKIAHYSGESSDWTSTEDKDFLHDLLDDCDGIIVGRTTYEIAAKPLAKRHCVVLTRSVKNIEQENDRKWLCPIEKKQMEQLIQRLGWKKVAILGGSQTYTFCLEQGLINELYLTIEPLAFGRGLNLFESKIDLNIRFSLVSTKAINMSGTILLHYRATPVL